MLRRAAQAAQGALRVAAQAPRTGGAAAAAAADAVAASVGSCGRASAARHASTAGAGAALLLLPAQLRAAPSFAAAAAAVAASGLLVVSTQCEQEEKAPEPLARLASIREAKEVTLYQYAVCPFCNQVLAFLDFHKIPYKVVEVNPLTKTELAWSTYKKVPVLVVDGEQLNDSAFIMLALKAKLQPSRRRAPDFASPEEERWFRWVNGRFVHVLTPNLYRTPGEAKQAFDYITTYMISHTKLKKKHNITDERAALYEAVGDFTAALGKRKFVGGDKPSVADVALFGVVRAVSGMDTFKDVMANTELKPWYDRMAAATGASAKIAA